MPVDAERVLSKLEGFKGAVVAKRDGSIIASKIAGGLDAKNLSKKAVGLIEAAEGYSGQFGASKISHIVASSDHGLMAVGCRGDYVVVGIMGAEYDSDSAASKIKKTVEELMGLVKS